MTVYASIRVKPATRLIEANKFSAPCNTSLHWDFRITYLTVVDHIGAYHVWLEYEYIILDIFGRNFIGSRCGTLFSIAGTVQ